MPLNGTLQPPKTPPALAPARNESPARSTQIMQTKPLKQLSDHARYHTYHARYHTYPL